MGEVQGGYDEHTGIKQTGNQIFYQKTSSFSSYICLSYRVDEERRKHERVRPTY